MKARYFILPVLLIVGSAAMAFSDDFIDDVYYWDSNKQPVSSPSRDAAETQTREEKPQSDVQIIFIEDSITQHSDTIVKAIIRR